MDAFTVLSDIESLITNEINDLIFQPLAIIAGGVSIMSISFVSAWGLYRALLIMSGMPGEPLLTFLKDFFLKIVIITIAATASYFNTIVAKPFLGVREELGAEMSGGNSSVFRPIEVKITTMIISADAIAGVSHPRNSMVDFIKSNDPDPPLVYLAMAHLDDAFSSVKKTAGDIADFFTVLWELIKAAIAIVGLLIFGLATFMAVMMNKIFFMLALGVGPLFIFFAAFNFSRNWFVSWISATLGYGFSYAIVMLVAGFLMNLFSKIYNIGNVTLLSTIISFVVCIVFAAIISNVSDFASAMFGASNLSERTSLTAKSGLYKSGKNAIGIVATTSRYGMSIGRRIGSLINRMSSVSKG